jgi:hypothetical protein
MGPALLEYEADQTGMECEGRPGEDEPRGLRSPSFVSLRGYSLIGY